MDISYDYALSQIPNSLYNNQARLLTYELEETAPDERVAF